MWCFASSLPYDWQEYCKHMLSQIISLVRAFGDYWMPPCKHFLLNSMLLIYIECCAVKPSSLPKSWVTECVLFARPVLSKINLKWLTVGIYLEGVSFNRRTINIMNAVRDTSARSKEEPQKGLTALYNYFGIESPVHTFVLNNNKYVRSIQAFRNRV